jgi:hypothetical protein
MDCPEILIRSISKSSIQDRYGNMWQYHSRSDRHSKVACWGIAFDMLRTSSILRGHVSGGRVVLGINHRMIDFGTGRAKNLDLVFARPEGLPASSTFASLVERYDIDLRPALNRELAGLPDCPLGPVGAVLVALEAKATMTAHVRALPRLYDELNSSHLCVHGSSRQALAIGFAMVNASSRFVSSDLNKTRLTAETTVVSEERQPNALTRTLQKLSEIPRPATCERMASMGSGSSSSTEPMTARPSGLSLRRQLRSPATPFTTTA